MTLHIFYREVKKIKYRPSSMGYMPAIARKYFLRLFFKKRRCAKVQEKEVTLLLLTTIVRSLACYGHIVRMAFNDARGGYFYEFRLLEIFNGFCTAISHPCLQATR